MLGNFFSLKILGFIFTLLPSTIGIAGVKSYDNKISVALANVNHNFNLNLSSTEPNVDTEVKYSANTASLSGFEVSYKGLTLAYLTSNSRSEKSIEQKGDTSYEDIRGGLFFGNNDQFVLLGYYNRFKKFYIDNTREIDPSADLYLKRKDLETFNSGAGLMYVFNAKEYSAAAAYVQSKKQTSSAGSLIAMLSLDTNIITGEEDLVPTEVENDFGEDKNLREGKFATTTLSLGYSHTLVYNNFFINATVLFGRGAQVRTYTVDNEKFEDTENTDKFSMGGSLGYNGDTVFAGVSLVVDDSTFEAGSVKLNPELSSTRMFLGYRF